MTVTLYGLLPCIVLRKILLYKFHLNKRLCIARNQRIPPEYLVLNISLKLGQPEILNSRAFFSTLYFSYRSAGTAGNQNDIKL